MFLQRLFPILLLVSCNSSTPPDLSRRSEARELAVKAQSPIQVQLRASQDSDAYGETSSKASASFALKPSVGRSLGRFSLQSNRLAMLPSRVSISQSQSEAVKAMCTDIAIVDDEGNAVNELTSLSDETINLAWRSHYGAADKEQIIGLALETGMVPRCLLQLKLTAENGKSSFVDIVFAPANTEKKFLVASQNHEKAIDEALLLINLDETGFIIDTQSGLAIDIDEPVDLSFGVKALNQTSVSISQSWVEECRTVNNDSLEAAEPERQVSLNYIVESEVSFDISDVLSASSNGRILSQCKSLEPSLNGKEIRFKTTCGDLLELVNLAADEMCAFTAYLKNTNDSDNTLGKRFRIERYSVEAADGESEDNSADIQVSNPREAYGVIPKSKYNPISNDLVVMNGFDQQQIAAAEVSFDIWLAHSKETYDRFFDNKIKQINYMDVSGPGCGFFSGAAAYAYLGDDRFYWCRAGYMSAQAVDPNRNAPAGAVYRALLMLHEVLHANNYNHDFDRSGYDSCDEGTSLSAVIPVEVVTCTKSYCQQFKDFAIRDYIEELNYSVTDERRFKGTCANWNTKLGLTRQSF